MRLRPLLPLLLLLLLWPKSSDAGPARVDWARGLVIADGVGLADRHAPSPAVARGTSRRAAEEAARQQLAAFARGLPLAAGGRVKDALKDEAAAKRLERAVAAALVVAADPETDGAWRVTMALPIEAVRQALAGPRTVSEDRGPAVIVVEGLGKAAKPAVGYTFGTLEAAAIWVSAVPEWAKDAPRVTAKRAKPGVIDVDGIDASAATLFVIVTGT